MGLRQFVNFNLDTNLVTKLFVAIFAGVNKLLANMVIVSTRDFRTNQSKYFRLAKAGEDVVLSSRVGNFKIIPLTKDDIITSKTELVNDLKHALKEVLEAKSGKAKLKNVENLLDEL